MTYTIRTEFINFIKENGRDILKNPQTFETSLQTYCSTKFTSNTYKTEAFILTEALREGIIQELLEVKSVAEALIKKISIQLQDVCGFTEYASDGAIDTWCYALGLKEIPVEKIEEVKVDESGSRNDKNIYIAKESYFYGIKNFIILFGLLNLFGAWGFYDEFKSDLHIITLIFDFSLLVFEFYILYLAINKKIEILKIIKYYLYFILPLGLMRIELGIQLDSTKLDFSRLYVYLPVIALHLLEIYILFRYFSKSDRVKATFGQYLDRDGFSLVIKNVSYKEYLRLKENKVAPIRSENLSDAESNPLISDKKKGSGIGLIVVGAIVFLLGIILTGMGYETASNRHRMADKSYKVFYGLITIGTISFIRGLFQMIKYYTQSSMQSERTKTQYSTNDYYSQKTENTNTNSSANDNYTKQSENVKRPNSDADYSKQTSNQSTKKEEQPKKEKTFEDRLEELKRLHEKGIITEAEFQTRKTEILKEL